MKYLKFTPTSNLASFSLAQELRITPRLYRQQSAEAELGARQG
jgi:hypothetical protein